MVRWIGMEESNVVIVFEETDSRLLASSTKGSQRSIVLETVNRKDPADHGNREPLYASDASCLATALAPTTRLHSQHRTALSSLFLQLTMFNYL